MSELTEFLDSESREQELEKANRNLQRQLSEAKRKSADLVEAVFAAAKEAAVVVGPAPAVPVPVADKRTGKPEWCLVHATDWQVGKETSSYNTKIAEQRLAVQFPDKVAELTEIQRSHHPVKNCALLLGGDMVEGVTIFPGQAWEVDSTLFEQVFSTVSIAEQLVRRLLATFERVEVWTEYGNHGRLGRKGDYPALDNTDNIVYRILADRFASEKRIAFHVNTAEFYNMVSIGEYRGLLIHGDEIKSFGGQTPAFGIARKLNAWASGVIEPFVDAYIGHFHQSLVVPLARGYGRGFLTPSPESDNGYAKEFMAATGTPGQRCHFIDPRKGRVTAEYVVWLD